MYDVITLSVTSSLYTIALVEFVFGTLLTFPAGSISQCVTITVNDDSAVEDDHEIHLSLSTTDPRVVLGNNMTTIFIEDNDGMLLLIYSLDILWNPSKPATLLEGWPHFRGEFVLKSMLWDLSKWPEYRGGHISGVLIRGVPLYTLRIRN